MEQLTHEEEVSSQQVTHLSTIIIRLHTVIEAIRSGFKITPFEKGFIPSEKGTNLSFDTDVDTDVVTPYNDNNLNHFFGTGNWEISDRKYYVPKKITSDVKALIAVRGDYPSVPTTTDS